MTKWKIYHNPRCTKSRLSVALLDENGIDFEIIEYLKTPPTVSDLKIIAKALKLSPEKFIRSKENIFKELDLSHASETELLKAMSENPVLIERPIIIKGSKAVIGRPPENINELL